MQITKIATRLALAEQEIAVTAIYDSLLPGCVFYPDIPEISEDECAFLEESVTYTLHYYLPEGGAFFSAPNMSAWINAGLTDVIAVSHFLQEDDSHYQEKLFMHQGKIFRVGFELSFDAFSWPVTSARSTKKEIELFATAMANPSVREQIYWKLLEIVSMSENEWEKKLRDNPRCKKIGNDVITQVARYCLELQLALKSTLNNSKPFLEFLKQNDIAWQHGAMLTPTTILLTKLSGFIKVLRPELFVFELQKTKAILLYSALIVLHAVLQKTTEPAAWRVVMDRYKKLTLLANAEQKKIMQSFLDETEKWLPASDEFVSVEIIEKPESKTLREELDDWLVQEGNAQAAGVIAAKILPVCKEMDANSEHYFTAITAPITSVTKSASSFFTSLSSRFSATPEAPTPDSGSRAKVKADDFSTVRNYAELQEVLRTFLPKTESAILPVHRRVMRAWVNQLQVEKSVQQYFITGEHRVDIDVTDALVDSYIRLLRTRIEIAPRTTEARDGWLNVDEMPKIPSADTLNTSYDSVHVLAALPTSR